MKKIRYVVLAILLVVSINYSVFAEEQKDSTVFVTQIPKEGQKGGTFVVDILMKQDTKMTDGKLYLTYPKDMLTYKNFEIKEAWKAMGAENVLIHDREIEGKQTLVITWVSEEPLNTKGLALSLIFEPLADMKEEVPIVVNTQRIYKEDGQLLEEHAKLPVTSVGQSQEGGAIPPPVGESPTDKGQEDSAKEPVKEPVKEPKKEETKENKDSEETKKEDKNKTQDTKSETTSGGDKVTSEEKTEEDSTENSKVTTNNEETKDKEEKVGSSQNQEKKGTDKETKNVQTSNTTAIISTIVILGVIGVIVLFYKKKGAKK